MFFKKKKTKKISDIEVIKTYNEDGTIKSMKFSIPVDGLSKEEANKPIAKLIADYKEDIIFDDNTGTIEMNNQSKLPYQKEYWF